MDFSLPLRCLSVLTPLIKPSNLSSPLQGRLGMGNYIWVCLADHVGRFQR